MEIFQVNISNLTAKPQVTLPSLSHGGHETLQLCLQSPLKICLMISLEEKYSKVK